MFEQPKIDARFSLPHALVQVFAIPPLLWIIAILISSAFYPTNTSDLTRNVFDYAGFGVAGLALGLTVRRFRAVWARSAGFTWLVPLGLVLCEMLTENRHHLVDLFVERAGHGEEGLGMILFTLPAFGCCCYSLGASLRQRSRRAVR